MYHVSLEEQSISTVHNVQYQVRMFNIPSSGVTQNAAKLPAAKPDMNDT